jgi:hypothetical protein
MNLFSLFRSKPKLVVDTQLGPFTLVYSKKGKNTWSGTSNEIILTVRGSESHPNRDQIDFLLSFETEFRKLDSAITKRFKSEFSEAGIDANFQNWQERFKVISADVMLFSKMKLIGALHSLIKMSHMLTLHFL